MCHCSGSTPLVVDWETLPVGHPECNDGPLLDAQQARIEWISNELDLDASHPSNVHRECLFVHAETRMGNFVLRRHEQQSQLHAL